MLLSKHGNATAYNVEEYYRSRSLYPGNKFVMYVAICISYIHNLSAAKKARLLLGSKHSGAAISNIEFPELVASNDVLLQ